MTPNDGQARSEPGLEPGADRFWGQFSQARAGRSRPGPEEPEPGAEDRAEPADGEGGPEPGAGTRPEAGHAHGECLEWCPICRSAELIRTAVPPELRDQAEALQREATHVLRAFLDAYAKRTAGAGGPDGPGPEGGPGHDRPAAEAPAPPEPQDDPAPGRVTDIPLE